MEGLASRTAHLESSKVGEEAARSDVIPTRQFLSSAIGEPRLVASRMAGATAGEESLAGLGRVCGLAGAAVAGFGDEFGDGGAAWAASNAAAQTANQTVVRTFRCKTPPGLFSSMYWKGGEQGNRRTGTEGPRERGTKEAGTKGARWREQGHGKMGLCLCLPIGTYLRLSDRAKRGKGPVCIEVEVRS